MSMFDITPSIERIAARPALRVETSNDVLREVAAAAGVEVVLELKLETGQRQYWLCTKGLSTPKEGVGNSCVQGYLTIYARQDDGSREGMAYAPNSIPRLQAVDYFHD